ncbi:MFS family permease [Alkalihalobacillus xiaoxiensis]|uniref:MFS family permease n=1 Tax=Shouchella xiaoxiensis TaxID=766895 RepID=A0ABS2SU80_9BACI|nr:hypothetical protein [Shouchella xiaoxiensis]MBM7839088.1 MFS family permease [Shouchella xiaoxiensis]
MEPIYLALLFIAIIAIGEVISIKSRARIPMLLVVVATVFVLLQTGILPESYIAASTFVAVGGVLVPVLIVHLGTMIPLKTMYKQYQAVLITLIGLTFSVVGVLTLVTLFFNYETAVAGAGPITGGIIAYIVTSEGLREAGFTAIIAVPIAVFTIQNFIGMPLTSIFLSRYAKKIRTDEAAAAVEVEEVDAAEQEQEKSYLLPKAWMQSHFVIIFLLFAGGALAVFLGQLTGINASLWALVIGVAGAALRFFPEKSMDKANSSGITMIALIFVVINSLIGVTWGEIVASLLPVMVIMVIGIAGLMLGAVIGAKLFKWDINKSIPVVLTALYGFPGDYLIVEEISRSEGRNEAEQKRIMDDLMPPMLIGGFTSVTVGSVAIASILISTL